MTPASIKILILTVFFILGGMAGSGADGFNPRSRYTQLILLEGGLSATAHSAKDISDLYGPDLKMDSTVSSFGPGLSVWYGISDAVCLGAGFDIFGKRYTITSEGTGVSLVEDWSIKAMDTYVGFRIQLLTLGSFYPYFTGRVGFLSLNGSTVTSTLTLTGQQPEPPGTVTLDNSTGSFAAGAGAMMPVQPWLGVAAEMGYRVASVSPIQAVNNGKESVLKNRVQPYSDAAIDMSGIYARLSLCVMLGGMSDEELFELEKAERPYQPLSEDYVPGEDTPYFDAGIEFFKRRMFPQSLDCFVEAGLEDPDNPKYFLYIADTLWRMGQRRRALDAYEDYLELQPDNEKLRRWVDDIRRRLRDR